MKKTTYVIALLAAAIGLQSCEGSQTANNYNKKTEVDDDGLVFIKAANEAGLAEIKASALAQSMSKNPRILSFAKMMIAEHTGQGNELTKIAEDKKVLLADTLTVQHQKTIDSLAHLSSDFDAAYMNAMVKDHIAATKLFEMATENRISAIQKFAKKALPALKMHLDSANAIGQSLK